MNAIKITGFGFVCLALVGISAAANASPADGRMSAADQKMLDTCTGKTAETMMKDTGCMNLMKKMNMSEAETKTMMSCRAMPNEAMMKDAGCMNMTKMHPEAMRMNHNGR